MDWFSQLATCQSELTKISDITYQHNPRELVHQRDSTRLFHYVPLVKQVTSCPVLVVFATVNKAEVLDLIPNRSFIRGLLAQGLDVYLLDWGAPKKNDATTFSDYVERYLKDAVQFIKNQSGMDQVNLTGICQGGLICLCYATINNDVKNLNLISTPIDFHTKSNVISNTN